MTETFWGVVYGVGLAWCVPVLAFAVCITVTSCYRRAARNKRRRDEAAQRAADVAHRVGMRWCQCCTRRSLRNDEVICPWCEAALIYAYEAEGEHA